MAFSFPGSQPDTWCQPRVTLPPPPPSPLPCQGCRQDKPCSQPGVHAPPTGPAYSPQPVGSVLRPEPSWADNWGRWGRPGHPPMLLTLPGAPTCPSLRVWGRRSLRGAAEDGGRLSDLPPLSAPRELSPSGGRCHGLHQAGPGQAQALRDPGLPCGPAHCLAPQALAKAQRCLRATHSHRSCDRGYGASPRWVQFRCRV